MRGHFDLPDKGIVTLIEVKAHLRLDSIDEDEYLISLVAAAVDYVQQYLGRSLDEFKEGLVPPSIKHAILLTIADLYENRTTTVIQNPTILQSLLCAYRPVRLP